MPVAEKARRTTKNNDSCRRVCRRDLDRLLRRRSLRGEGRPSEKKNLPTARNLSRKQSKKKKNRNTNTIETRRDTVVRTNRID